MGENFNKEVLKNMKAQDKAKAFDMIVDAFVKNNEPSSDIANILNWCSEWFGD